MTRSLQPRSRRRGLLLLAAVLLVVATVPLAAPSAAAPLRASRLASLARPHAANRAIEMKGFRFRPDSVRLMAGDTVVWSNSDDEPHTITMDTSTFDSGDIGPGSRFRWVFRQKGRFRYHCEVHPKMKGVLDVR